MKTIKIKNEGVKVDFSFTKKIFGQKFDNDSEQIITGNEPFETSLLATILLRRRLIILLSS